MTLVHEITGSLLLNLAGTDTSSARAGGSSVGGQGTSASFDSDPVALGAGLTKGASIFAASIVRLDDAITNVGLAKKSLTSLATISAEMLELAELAADGQTSDADRARYNSQYKSLVAQFSDAQELAEDEEDNYLEMSDLRDKLKESGIDLDAATELAATFERAGGKDDELGYEKYTMPDGSRANPLKASLSTYEDAQKALEPIKHLEQQASADLESVEFVMEELKSARAFAVHSYNAFNDASSGRVRTTDPEALAAELLSTIRTKASDPMLSAHSNLDSKLVQELLNYQ